VISKYAEIFPRVDKTVDKGRALAITTCRYLKAGRKMKTSNWADLGQWFRALTRHWIARIGGPLVAAFQILYGIWRRDWPPALGWAILAGCFVWAAFLAWRDEHRKTIGKARRAILNEYVDVMQNAERGWFVDPVTTLIKLSDRFGSEEDVEWVCEQLDQHGHSDPFKVIAWGFEVGAFDGKRLKFLWDARVAEPEITSVSDALSFLERWAPRNGLTPKNRSQS
jgi:hypothetical protein